MKTARSVGVSDDMWDWLFYHEVHPDICVECEENVVPIGARRCDDCLGRNEIA